MALINCLSFLASGSGSHTALALSLLQCRSYDCEFENTIIKGQRGNQIQVNAKLGDYLGMNFWDEKTRYGGTLQSAVDHIIGLSPGKENVLEVIPHAAAIAAAYGDPGNKYLNYIQGKRKDYTQQSFWLYDQVAALTSSPAAMSKSRRGELVAEHPPPQVEAPTGVTSVTSPIEKACPAVFRGQQEIELDPGIFASCDLLRPFYPA